MSVAWVLASIIIFVILWYAFSEGEPGGLLAVAIVIGVTSCHESDWYQAGEREREAQRTRQVQAERTPHVIREADGCKVYAFTTDREHYFTRCGSTVTTETQWSKSCGKSCTKHESDTIVTEGNK